MLKQHSSNCNTLSNYLPLIIARNINLY